MTVHFIGAGPGAPDLITLRGLKILKKAQVVLYAGSLVPSELMEEANNAHTIIDTAAMTLDEIIAIMQKAHAAKEDVARVHSGDPSLYGAVNEQINRLQKLSIDYDITPGVPAYAAAAARIKQELTIPDLVQTIILTRTAVRTSKMPLGEELSKLGASGATIAIHLSINNLKHVVNELTPHYGPTCPVVIAYRVTWPDEIILRGTLENIRDKTKGRGITRTALIIVGQALSENKSAESHLYCTDHTHIFRPS